MVIVFLINFSNSITTIIRQAIGNTIFNSFQLNGSIFKNKSNAGTYDATICINVTTIIEINKNGFLQNSERKIINMK